jgi:hypothetical protein
MVLPSKLLQHFLLELATESDFALYIFVSAESQRSTTLHLAPLYEYVTCFQASSSSFIAFQATVHVIGARFSRQL